MAFHIDAGLGPFHRQAAGERHHRAFGRRVGGNFRQRHKRVEGRDVDNLAPAGLRQRLVERLAGAEHARHVDVEQAVPLGFGNLYGGFAEDLAGRVEENVDATERIHHGIAKAVDRFAGSHVAGMGETLASNRLDFSRHLLNEIFPPAGGNHVSAGFGESNRQFSTDAGGATHHHGNAAAEIHEILRQGTNGPFLCKEA